jgi:hypothetical protein
LISITLGGTTIWDLGPTTNVSTVNFSTPAVIPAGATVRIVFLFDKSYDNFDNPKTEKVTINVITNGCSGVVIQSP